MSSLVGRARDLAGALEALEGAMAGHGNVLLLSGEAGIGKTRLAQEISLRAVERGFISLWGRAWEGDGAPVLLPWAQVVQACRADERTRGLFDDALLAALGPLLPHAPSRPEALDPELNAYRLSAAVLALLRAASTCAPVLLVLDDLHVCDLASLELLERVAREVAALPVFVLGTYREREARRAPPVASLLGRLSRHGVTRPVGPIDADAVRQWLDGALSQAASAEFVDAVFAITEGHPLFLDALLHLLLARGLGATLPLQVALPETIREVVRQCVERVPVGARGVLEAASVLGRECSPSLLARVSGRSDLEVQAALEAGFEAGIFDLHATPSSPVRFAHVLIRETLYQDLPARIRIELHARATEALRALYAADGEASLTELAHHRFESAGEGTWDEAAELTYQAGLRAYKLLAFDESAKHFQRALDALGHVEGRDPGRRVELLWRLGVSQLRLGQARLGRESCEQAAELAAQSRNGEALAQAALALGAELVPGRVDARLVQLLETALAHGTGDRALDARVKARLAAAMMPTPHRARPRALAREAIAEARSLADSRVLAQVLSTARAVLTPADDLDERFAQDRELAELARGLGERLLEVQAEGRLVTDAIELGDPLGVEAHLLRHGELSREIHSPPQQLRDACLRVLWFTMRGDDEGVEQAESDIRRLSAMVEDRRALVTLEFNRIVRLQCSGAFAELREARATLQGLMANDPRGAYWNLMWRNISAAQEGRLDDARALFEVAGPIISLGPPVLLALTPAFLVLGDRDCLQQIYDALLPHSSRISVNMALLYSEGPVARFLGDLAAALGLPDRAAAHHREARELNERAGLQLFLRAVPSPPLVHAANTSPAPVAAPPEAPEPPTLVRDGEIWVLSHGPRVVQLKDSKGLHYLAMLLREPDRQFYVGELVEADHGERLERQSADAGEMLDQRAIAAYRERLTLIESAVEHAELQGDRASLARLALEREALASELSRATGLGGRTRRSHSLAERARVNVQRRLRDVIDRVSQADAELGRYLELRIKTGTLCTFRR